MCTVSVDASAGAAKSVGYPNQYRREIRSVDVEDIPFHSGGNSVVGGDQLVRKSGVAFSESGSYL